MTGTVLANEDTVLSTTDSPDPYTTYGVSES